MSDVGLASEQPIANASRDRTRLGFVAQPWDLVPAVHASSLAIWIDEVSRRAAKHLDVTVYSPRTEHFADETQEAGVRHIRIGTDLDRQAIARIRRWEGRLQRYTRLNVDLFHPYYYYADRYHRHYISTIAERARKDCLDVVLVMNFSQFLAPIRSKNPTAKLLLMMQCDWLVELPVRNIHARLAHADAILGCSNYIGRGVQQRFPVLSARIRTLYNGSSESALRGDGKNEDARSEYGIGEDDLVVLFVSRITPEKGLHVLVEAMKSVVRSVPNAMLVVAGPFAFNPRARQLSGLPRRTSRILEQMKSGYESYVRELAGPLGDRFRIIGVVPHAQLWSLYSAGDVFVHPSIWNEPFGMILTEAMLAELPVVSTTVGGIPEIVVEGETGLLVTPNDASLLCEAIVSLLRDPARRTRMGQAGRRRVCERFTWDHTAENLVEQVAEVTAVDG